MSELPQERELALREVADILDDPLAQYIEISSDVGGLRIAAAEMFEESLDAGQREKNERVAAMSSDPELVLRAAPSTRTLTPGYYLWLVYVIETIWEPMEDGISISASELDADEIQTLHILRQARAEFQRKHPPCNGCGAPLRNAWDKTCGDCMKAQGFKSKRSEG